jgi:hypothetical protein
MTVPNPTGPPPLPLIDQVELYLTTGDYQAAAGLAPALIAEIRQLQAVNRHLREHNQALYWIRCDCGWVRHHTPPMDARMDLRDHQVASHGVTPGAWPASAIIREDMPPDPKPGTSYANPEATDGG